jgi:hypothetical protein
MLKTTAHPATIIIGVDSTSKSFVVRRRIDRYRRIPVTYQI